MKYIALDIGNVICHADMGVFIENVSNTFNVSVTESSRWLRSFQQMHDLGLTTMDNQLRDHFGCQSEPTIKRLITHWNDLVFPNFEMISFLTRLKNEGVQIALLSNIGVEHAEMMKTKLSSIHNSSVKHFSCFVGARKPTVLYYQSFLMRYPEFYKSIYVDDLQENLDTGSNFGFRPYKFDLSQIGPAYVRDKIKEIEELIVDSPDIST